MEKGKEGNKYCSEKYKNKVFTLENTHDFLQLVTHNVTSLPKTHTINQSSSFIPLAPPLGTHQLASREFRGKNQYIIQRISNYFKNNTLQ